MIQNASVQIGCLKIPPYKSDTLVQIERLVTNLLLLRVDNSCVMVFLVINVSMLSGFTFHQLSSVVSFQCEGGKFT